MIAKGKRKMSIIAYMLVVCMIVGLLPTTAFAEEQTFVCEKELHSHDENCYDENEILVCEVEEHSHTNECLSENAKEQEQNNIDKIDTEDNTEEEKAENDNEDNTEEVTENDNEGNTEEVTENDNEDNTEEEVTENDNEANTEEVTESDNKVNAEEQKAESDSKVNAEEQKTESDNKVNAENSNEEQTAMTTSISEQAEVAASCNGNHDTGWTELTESNLTITQKGNYYLTDNISGSITIDGIEVTLCLNGKTLTGNGSGSVITVRDGAKLTLCDCKNDAGKITGGKQSGVSVSSMSSNGNLGASSTFIMTGGTITGNTADNGGGVYVGGGSSFTMNGGTITANTASYGGGGVYLTDGATFEMTGGTISDNTATSYGGGVYVSDGCTFSMSGGEISSTKNNSVANNGGGVFVGYGATFNMSGGSITGHSVKYDGGGVYVSHGTFTMSGTAEISGNKANENGGGVAIMPNINDNSGGSTFTMNGGAISDNKVEGYGAGVYVAANSTFNVSGTAEISENIFLNKGTANNVYLPKGKTITVTGALTGEIGVSVTTENLPTKNKSVTVAEGSGYEITKEDNACFTSDTERYTTLFDASSKTVVLKAVYTVTFKNDDGTTVTTQKVVGGEKATAPTLPTKEDYEFLGWFVNEEGVINSPTGFNFDTTAITEDITFTAKWQKMVYLTSVVTFDSDGGSAVTSQTVKMGEKATEPTPPTRDGYMFVGWFMQNNLFDFDTEITTGIALKAKWKKILNITFDSDGGSAVANQTLTEGEKITKPADPTKQGYAFLGWYVADTLFDFDTEITTDIALTAKWKEVSETEIVVIFNSDGGSAVDAQAVTIGGKATKPANPTKDGYIFLGWYVADTLFDFDTEITENITLTAKWQGMQLTVTFDSNGGSAVASQMVEKGGKATRPENPTKNGSTFLGWVYNGTSFDFENTPIMENITLRANWYSISSLPSFSPVVPANQKYTISGSVTYSDGTPIANISLEIKKRGVLTPTSTTVYTDNQGKYVASNMEKGNYTITASTTINGSPKTASRTATVVDEDVTQDIVFPLSETADEMLPAGVYVEIEPADIFDGEEEFEGATIEGLEEEAEEHAEPNTVVKLSGSVKVAYKVADIPFSAKDKVIGIALDQKVANIKANTYQPTKISTIVVKPSVTKETKKLSTSGATPISKDMVTTKKALVVKVPANKVKIFEKNLKAAGFKGKVKKARSSASPLTQLSGKSTALQNDIEFNTLTQLSGNTQYDFKLNQLIKLAGEPMTQYEEEYEDDDVPYDDVEEFELTLLESEPATPQDGTFWVNDDEICICTTEMAYFLISYEEDNEEEDSKQTSKKSSGRTGSWVKEQKIEEIPKIADAQITENTQQNSANSTENSAKYDNCTKDASCTLSKFVDMNVNEWYHDGAHYCVENGLMSGVSSTQFAPHENATRAMIVAILWRIENSPIVDNTILFDDVPENAYYKDAVRWAVSAGIVSGYDEKTFAPNDNITREQMASILYRYTQYKGKDTSVQNADLHFEDGNNMSAYAVEAMNWACGAGVINGTSSTTLSPKGNATRAQIAQMLKVYLVQ